MLFYKLNAINHLIYGTFAATSILRKSREFSHLIWNSVGVVELWGERRAENSQPKNRTTYETEVALLRQKSGETYTYTEEARVKWNAPHEYKWAGSGLPNVPFLRMTGGPSDIKGPRNLHAKAKLRKGSALVPYPAPAARYLISKSLCLKLEKSRF